jgi:hypothetical protein
MASKVLSDNGIGDSLILEVVDRIDRQMMKHDFVGLTLECGVGWVIGVGGNKENPIWEISNKHSLHTCYSDYRNLHSTFMTIGIS